MYIDNEGTDQFSDEKESKSFNIISYMYYLCILTTKKLEYCTLVYFLDILSIYKRQISWKTVPMYIS